MYKITNHPTLLTVSVQMSGHVTDEEVALASQEMKRIVDTYRGKPHLFLADMRGMKPLSAQAATILYDAIAYTRRRGTVCCVHLSDSAIARMQAARVAREASPGEDVTVEVVSMEEAEQVLKEQRLKIWGKV